MRIKDVRNTRAWTEFDSIYRPMLRRFATANGLCDADTEDLVQECMGAIHKHIERFDYDPNRGRFRGWLRTMVNNRVRTLLRKQRHPIAKSHDLKRIENRDESPEAVFDRMLEEEHLKYCLRLVKEELEEKTFDAFRYYVVEEWPVEKVCKTLTMTPSQLYTIKWRVTRKLQEKMNDLLHGGKSGR